MADRYRKRPVEVEAVRWTGDNADELDAFAGDRFDPAGMLTMTFGGDIDAAVYDVLHSTWVRVSRGQWVIRGVQGEFYPCADDVFRATYESIGPKPVYLVCENGHQSAVSPDYLPLGVACCVCGAIVKPPERVG